MCWDCVGGGVVSRIVPEKGTLTVEFKSDQPKKLQDPDIFDAVVAFANSEGGIYT